MALDVVDPSAHNGVIFSAFFRNVKGQLGVVIFGRLRGDAPNPLERPIANACSTSHSFF
jgi:hypothetical protein